MKMAEKDMTTDTLEQLFAEARDETVHLPDELMQRILADAERQQVDAPQGAVADGSATASGFWHQMLAMLGGWPAMGGLAAACAAGVWIGLAPPTFLPDPAELVMGVQSDIDLIDSNEFVLALSEE